jgi:hypothetical protein
VIDQLSASSVPAVPGLQATAVNTEGVVVCLKDDLSLPVGPDGEQVAAGRGGLEDVKPSVLKIDWTLDLGPDHVQLGQRPRAVDMRQAGDRKELLKLK